MTSTTAKAAKVYFEAIGKEAPRVLGLMDREPLSPTRGCMDRTYWGWKFTDFPGARFQEGVCVLSFLYTSSYEQNPYRGNAHLLEWIAAGFDAWSRIQYAGGDFDEAYPFEHSLAATSFTAFYLSEAFRMLEEELPEPTRDRFKTTLERAGTWLTANDERHGFLTNHLAAAAAALYHAYQICGHSRFEERSRHFLQRILDHQSDEGWYDEYGGADPGYQSHGSFYLARLHELGAQPRLGDSLQRSFGFVKHFVHVDGSFGGEYASRNTQFYYPAAFEMMSGTDGSAAWIADAMLDSVRELSAPGAGSMDAYNYFPLLNNYVFAHLACSNSDHRQAALEPPPAGNSVIHFPGAGLLKVRRDQYDLYVGLAKGGVIKAFDRPNRVLVYNDCGYLGELRNGSFVSTQVELRDRPVRVDDAEVVVEGRLYAFNRPLMRPLKFLLFRIFNLTLGRVGRIGYWLKSFLVKALIYKKEETGIEFRRSVLLEDRQFVVRDRLRGRADGLHALSWVDLFTTIHMGSSKYFVPSDLEPEARRDAELDCAKLADGIELERRVTFETSRERVRDRAGQT